MRQFIFDVISFFFPVYCPVCKMPIWIARQVICIPCELGMPRTGYIKDPENPVAQIFWGRTNVEQATALFLFEKGSAYQTLMHGLKYKGEKKTGIYLGKMLGSELKDSPFGRCRYIIPVPLHKKKLKKRTYNQSEIIAFGVSEITGIPVKTDVLIRKEYTRSQTKKARYERYENMKDVFSLTQSDDLPANCSILLIDDVVTTGATLEACVEALLQLKGIKVFVATVACA